MYEDFCWFQKNYTDINNKYGDCFVAIKDKAVVGAYKTYAEAVHAMEKTEEKGTFIVQECRAGGVAYQACIASMNFES